MSFYTVLLFVHVLAAACWVGGGIMVSILAERATRSEDPVRIQNLLEDAGAMGKKFFAPASGITLLAGVWLVFQGDWGWDHWFILAGLLAVVLSTVLGFGILEPTAIRVGEAMKGAGALTDGVRADLNKLRLVSRIDNGLLVVVVFLMTNKPGS